MMLSSNSILVIALFLLLRSCTVMSSTPIREGSQIEENHDYCDVLRKLIDNASEAKQSLENYNKIHSLFFADGLEIKAEFRLKSDKIDEKVIIPKKVTEDPKFVFLVYSLFDHSIDYRISCIDDLCYTCKERLQMLDNCPQLAAEHYAKIGYVNIFKLPALEKLSDKTIVTNFQRDTCKFTSYFNLPPSHWCKEKISAFDFFSISRIYYNQFSNVAIEMKFDLCEKLDSSKCYQFRLALPCDTSKAPYWITRWRKPAILTLIDPVNGMKIDYLKNLNGKKKNDGF